MAIESSVLEYVVTNIKCKTLFITHYPQIGLELSQRVRKFALAIPSSDVPSIQPW
jgi:DNA mismatch repair ATPase MutS